MTQIHEWWVFDLLAWWVALPWWQTILLYLSVGYAATLVCGYFFPHTRYWANHGFPGLLVVAWPFIGTAFVISGIATSIMFVIRMIAHPVIRVYDIGAMRARTRGRTVAPTTKTSADSGW